MSPEEIAAVLLGLPEVTEQEPFEPGVPVYKVAGKVFAIYQPGPPTQITLKCDPGWALHLRAEYTGITPGYHVNKRLWNTVSLDGSIPDDVLTDLVRHSYEQVAAGLPKSDRERVLAQFNEPGQDESLTPSVGGPGRARPGPPELPRSLKEPHPRGSS